MQIVNVIYYYIFHMYKEIKINIVIMITFYLCHDYLLKTLINMLKNHLHELQSFLLIILF